MGCGCGKNKGRSRTVRSPGNRRTITPTTTNRSVNQAASDSRQAANPAASNARITSARRRIDQLRRDAIRKAFGK